MQNYRFNNLYQIITNNTKTSPSKTIIWDGELKLSNQEFKQRIDQIARFLSDHGIDRGDKVALIMSNSREFIACVFAISKIGGIFVPVNNFLKEDEFAYIVNDAQAKMVIASSKFAKDVQNLITKTNIDKIVWVDNPPLSNEKNLNLSTAFDPNFTQIDAYDAKLEDTACLVYTSGTTGKPKGAMLSFKNILSNCFGSQTLMDLKDGQLKIIAYLPMFHAFTLTVNVLLPLATNSGVIVIRSISNKKDFKHLLKTLLLSRCRYFTGVPDIYSAMANAKLPWYFHWFHSVRGFISGAAPLSDEVLRKFKANFKRGTLLQGYGISECSPVVSCNTLKANREGSVGRPLEGYEVMAFSEDMQALPADSIGELCVKGDCVMQGYYNREKDTQEAIVDGWFRTGDIGKVDKDGYIYIIDRKKDLIISKGMNIYPREIEEILYTHPRVNACAVIGITEKDGNEIPLAYIELKEGQIATESEIKDFVRPHLASFKQPKRVIFIDKLPRNATGKILKRELRDLHKTQGN